MAQMDPPNSQYNPMRVLIKIQKSDPPTLEQPRKWSSFFKDFIDCCLKKNPNDRCSAEQLKSHPFVKDARNPRPIIELICEKNAEVMEEIIDEDVGSIDGSIVGSVLTGEFESSDDRCSKSSPERMDRDLDLENRIPNAIPLNGSNSKQLPRKKFAAPLPPQSKMSVGPSEPLKELTIDSSPLQAHNISPGKEAIEILDDLCNALDCDEAPTSSSSSPRRYQNHTPTSQTDDYTPSHKIRDLSAEYAKQSDSKEMPITSHETASTPGKVVQIAATFNVRPPNQNSREFNVKRPTAAVEVKSVEESQSISMDGKGFSNDRRPKPLKHQQQKATKTPETSKGSPKEHHSRADSGVDSQEFVSVPPVEPAPDYEELNAAKRPEVTVRAEKRTEIVPNRRVIEEPQSVSISSSSTNDKQSTPVYNNNKLLNRSLPNRATVTRKTRTYVVDGVQMTSTSLHVLGAQQDYALRRKELQELKRLQRREARDQQLLNDRNEFEKDTQEKKFNEYRSNILKDFEIEYDQLSKVQKKKMEELEKFQEEEKLALLKNVKNMQQKEYREFQLQQRDEMKRLKYEVDVLPRSQRKEVYKHRREMLEQIQTERDTNFIASKRNMSEKIMDSLQQAHQEKLARLDRQFLNERHDLQRGVESALWDNEFSHMKNRFELRRQQLKDNFAIQRSHMMNRHRLELERIKKTHQSNEDVLARSLAVARKQLPKTLRAESKTRSNMFKESLQINHPEESPQKRAQMINEFEKAEQLRLKQKLEEYNMKCQRRLDELRDSNMGVEAELEEIHANKHDMIMKNEAQKVKDFENEYAILLAEFENNLPKRKHDLEEKFRLEIEQQEHFYKGVNGIGHPNP